MNSWVWGSSIVLLETLNVHPTLANGIIRGAKKTVTREARAPWEGTRALITRLKDNDSNVRHTEDHLQERNAEKGFPSLTEGFTHSRSPRPPRAGS
ncbi:MAG: hypothetical protein ACE5OZ_04290 [Candidatus Heimdallarchaeota archaeon]